jgi:hypothetical protein
VTLAPVIQDGPGVAAPAVGTQPGDPHRPRRDRTQAASGDRRKVGHPGRAATRPSAVVSPRQLREPREAFMAAVDELECRGAVGPPARLCCPPAVGACKPTAKPGRQRTTDRGDARRRSLLLTKSVVGEMAAHGLGYELLTKSPGEPTLPGKSRQDRNVQGRWARKGGLSGLPRAPAVTTVGCAIELHSSSRAGLRRRPS